MDDPIMEDEIFGPLLPILTYKDMECGHSRSEEAPKPLSGFSSAGTRRQSIISSRACHSAGGAINQVTFTCLSKHALWRVGYSGIVTTTARPALTLHAREIGSYFAARRRHRAPVPAVHGGKGSKRSASGLNTRPRRSQKKAIPKEHRDKKICEKITYRLPNSFFTAYDAHDLMACSLFARMAHLDDMLRTAARAWLPIRGGIDVIWRAFPNAVPNFRVKVIELIPAEGNTVVIQPR